MHLETENNLLRFIYYQFFFHRWICMRYRLDELILKPIDPWFDVLFLFCFQFWRPATLNTRTKIGDEIMLDHFHRILCAHDYVAVFSV